MPASPTWARLSLTFFSTAASSNPRCSRTGKWTLSKIGIESRSAAPSNSTPNLRRILFNSVWRSLVMSLPSTTMPPRSGNRSAFRCFNRTVFPEPLPPMIVVILPVSSSRLTPLSTSWRPKVLYRSTTRIMKLEHDRRHEIIPNQNHDEAEHDRFGGRLADSGGHRRRIKPLVAANAGDDQAEAHRFQKTAEHVLEHHAELHAREIAARADAEELDADDETAVDRDHVEDCGQKRHGNQTGHNARRDQILDRIDRHGIKSVDLLGDFHAADFRGHGRAGAPGAHESGEHRTELAQDAEGDRGAEKIFRVELSQTVIALQTHDHAGKNARQNHHGKRLDADGANVMDDQTQPRRRTKRPGEGRGQKQKGSSHADRPLDRAAADLTNP